MRKKAQTSRPSSSGAIVLAALALLAGDLLLQSLPQLPPAWIAPFCLMVAVLLVWRWPRMAPLAVLLFGFAWSAWHAGHAIRSRLPDALAGSDFDVVGTVDNLPRTRHGVSRFRFKVESARLDGRAQALDGKLQLAWYGRAAHALGACQRWQLHVRLKPPRAMLNPGGFDGERQALQRGVVAVGYVRDDGPDRHLADVPMCVDRVRARLSAAIAAQLGNSDAVPLLQALAVGDKRGIDDRAWQVARVTGVSHLLAISGFHVGVAALLGVWLAGLLWRGMPSRLQCWPRQNLQGVTGFAVALGYALLAGMSLPTQRALIMIGVVCLARLGRRASRPAASLALALVAVLLLDPLAVLSAGLWLSFAGVAFLLLGLVPQPGWRGWLTQLGRAQGLMTVALLPLGVWFFGQASVLGAPANLIAVPMVSLLVVPLTLLGSIAWFFSAHVAGLLWQGAGWLVLVLWRLLERLASWPVAHWYLPQAPMWSLLLAMLGALWLLVPRGLPARWLGLVLFLPLLLPRLDLPQQGAFRMTVLDVGQGLSVLVRTRHHALLYDAGARFPSGFDLGEAVVIPALHALGVGKLDMLMVSHGDNDHAGGAPAVARAWPQALLSGSEPERTHLPLAACRSGQAWHWDGVSFRVLHPDDAWPQGSNDGSCVLLISARGGRALLTGDISRLVEPVVARRVGPGAPLVLLVPHHGSKSSSSTSFLARLAPRLAVVSAGWHNRFGHPAAPVVARYARAGIPLYNTARSGAVAVDFPNDAAPLVRARLRCDRRHYWRHHACAQEPKRAANTAIMRPLTNLPE